MKAIQTRYAGCHFRSRLEARWAVFFDALDIAWEYEPEGFEMGDVKYLPDFWLPESQVWVEIKGHQPNESDVKKLLHLAAEVCVNGHRVRLLGPLPQEPIGFVPPGADEVFGWGVPCVVATASYLIPKGLNEHGSVMVDLADQHGIPAEDWIEVRSIWIPGHAPNLIADALSAARSARFEHGQSGAT